MVDLHLGAGRLAADEVDPLAGVGIGVEQPGEHHAVVRGRVQHLVEQVAAQDVVAGVAPVAVDVGPGLAELVTVVPGHRGAALDGQRPEQSERCA